MFNEILKSVDKFINGETFEEQTDKSTIAKYLSLAYDIPADSIVKLTRIKMNKIPDIILVSIDYQLPNRICDYMFYEGELVKVISFFPQLWGKSEANEIAMILAIFGDINNTLIESYRKYMEQQMTGSSFVDTLTYAPFIMAMAYIQSHLPFMTDQVVSVTFRLMYPKVTEKSIVSVRRLLTQFTVSDLLDKCVWYGVTNQEYPDIRFCELPDPVAKSSVPGKGVWNMSDMEDDNESDEDEFPEEELDSDEDGDDYPFNEEEIAEGIQAQEDSHDQPDNFTVDDMDEYYDRKKPISYHNPLKGKK